MTAKNHFLMFHVIKNYISKKEKFKSAEDAINKLMERFNQAIKTVLADSGKLAAKDRRKTILQRDVEAALEKNLGKTDLTAQELLEEVLKQNPTDLGHISQGISIYLRKQKK